MKNKLLLLFLIFSLTRPISGFEPLSMALPDPHLCLYLHVGKVFPEIFSFDAPSQPGTIEPAPPLATFASWTQQAELWKQEIKNQAGTHKDRRYQKKAGAKNQAMPILSWFRSIVSGKNLHIESLWFFYKDSGEYLVGVTGDIRPEEWKGFFSKNSLIARGTGFSVAKDLNSSQGSSVLLHFGRGFAFLCPTNLEGAVMDGIEQQQARLGEQWGTFQRMLSLKPTLALEMEPAIIWESIFPDKKGFIPSPLGDILRFRCVIAPNLFKAQAFLPNEDARNLVTGATREFRHYLEKTFPPANPATERFRDYSQGQSVFLESLQLPLEARYLESAQLGIIAGLIAQPLQSLVSPSPEMVRK